MKKTYQMFSYIVNGDKTCSIYSGNNFFATCGKTWVDIEKHIIFDNKSFTAFYNLCSQIQKTIL